MDLNQLEVFFMLGKVKNFTETAKLMYVTQSAISHAIKKLEKSLDLRLITRSGRNFSLTPAGRELFHSCEKIFYEVEHAKDNLKNHRENPVWNITLGSPVEFGNTILIPLINDFMQAYPNYQLDFLFSNSLSEPLVTDEVDFIIDCKEHFATKLTRLQLFREEYAVVASPDYVRQCNLLEVAALENVTVLSLDNKRRWWSNFLMALPAHLRPRFKSVTAINHIRGMIVGALVGMGVRFVPRYTVSKELEIRLLVAMFGSIRPLADNFCIYIKQEKLALAKNKHLVDYLRSLAPAEFGNPEM